MTLDREIEIGLWNCMQIMIAQIATEKFTFFAEISAKELQKSAP